MDPERFTSAVRLELRPGEWVLWDLRPHRFESLRDQRANEHQLFAMHQRQRNIVERATSTTKAARRRAEKKLRGDTATLLAPDSIDYSKDPVWLPRESWEDPL